MLTLTATVPFSVMPPVIALAAFALFSVKVLPVLKTNVFGIESDVPVNCSVVPVAKVMVLLLLLPNALLLPTANVPPLTLTEPVNVLLPERASTPAPPLFSTTLDPLITPAEVIISLSALVTSISTVPARATVPEIWLVPNALASSKVLPLLRVKLFGRLRLVPSNSNVPVLFTIIPPVLAPALFEIAKMPALILVVPT